MPKEKRLRKKYKNKKCEHGIQKAYCKPCGGSAFCEHGIRKDRCKPCGGSALCEHGIHKAICKPCGGSAICEHGIQKAHCKPGGGSAICEHGIRKATCKPCGGSALCEHGIQKASCTPCGGSAICDHGIQKAHCKPCGGSAICEHGIQKASCKPCGGSRVCVSTFCDHCVKSKNKYDGYCATCFKNLFPTDPRSQVIYTHTKEIRVRNYINEHFDGFIHDKPIWYKDGCDCTHLRRIDHRKLIGNTMLAIETDEFAHRSYDDRDEEIRYDDLYMVYSGKWIFIRFNPDNNRAGVSGATSASRHVDMEDKLQVLHDTMLAQLERIEAGENDELVEIIYLFY